MRKYFYRCYFKWGDTELIKDDSTRLANRIVNAGGRAKCEIWKGERKNKKTLDRFE